MSSGICWATLDALVGSFTMGSLLAAFERADEMGQLFLLHCDASLRIHPFEDAAPELGWLQTGNKHETTRKGKEVTTADNQTAPAFHKICKKN